MEQLEEKGKINFKRNFYTNDDSGKMFLLSLFAPLVVSFVILFICQLIGTSMGLEYEVFSKQPWYVIIAYLITPLSLGLTFWAYNKVAKVSLGAVKLKFNVGWKNVLIAIAVAVVALFGLQYLVTFIDQGLIKIGFSLSETLLPNNNFGWFVLNALLLAVMPAIFEELIFRGVVLQGLRRNFSDWLAILISAVMFTLMHGSLQQFVYPLALGLILGWIVVRGGSLLLSMIVHFTSNFVVVLLDYLQNVLSFDMNLPSSWWGILISVLLVALVGVIIFLIDRFYFKRFKNDAEVSTDKKEPVKKPSIFLIISIVVAVILLILNTIVNFI